MSTARKRNCVAIGDTCNPRRSNDKRLKTLEDICSTMTSRDSRKNFLPNFASLDLNNVPSTDDGNPTLGQILASLNDLKRNTVTTDMLKESLKSFKETLTPSFSVFPSLREPEAEFASPMSQVSDNASVIAPFASSLMQNAASDSTSQSAMDLDLAHRQSSGEASRTG